jgi:chromosome segregation protein
VACRERHTEQIIFSLVFPNDRLLEALVRRSLARSLHALYLKSLTLRGFKSFASSTTLQLEPGITCVVGPNGSGKSNVVDALAWVMGEQGAKSLRGGKMEDVIFAGTAGRAPLGRAEVVLTIDNTDGALAIDYTEVTISRTMFRNGGSEYAINGNTCRLLDVQELLSDSGIGKQMHVIVGQGQLDEILHASPEERRGFVEEAAGVLKHRKRKEKALRKLDATDGNLTRLGDLLVEVRRQLKPLGRQAEVARKATVIQADARDARARLLADDAAQLLATFERELADEALLRERLVAVENRLAAARLADANLDAALVDAAPRLAQAQDLWFQLSALQERLSGTSRLAGERLRNTADEPVSDRPSRDPQDLEAEAARIAKQEAEIGAEVAVLDRALQETIAARQRAEDAHLEEDRRVAGLARAAADRREGVARFTGQVHAKQSRIAATDEELGRLAEAHAAALARAERAQRDFTALEIKIAGLESGERNVDAEYEVARAQLTDLDAQIGKLRDELHTAEQDRAALNARKDALEMGLTRKDGAGALIAASDELTGVLGSVAALVSVRPGKEVAVAAALGASADAVAVSGLDPAIEALDHLKQHDLGRAGMVLADDHPSDVDWPALPSGAEYAVDLIEAPTALRSTLRRVLGKVAVVDDLAAAGRLVRARPELVAVTADGDLIGRHIAAGGSSSQPSLIEVQAALDETGDQLRDATATAERLRFELSGLEAVHAEATTAAEVALAKLHESDASMAAVAQELGQLGGLARSSVAEAQRVEAAMTAAQSARNDEIRSLEAMQARLAAAKESPDEEPDASPREEAALAARSARQAETDARLALRTAEERARALHGRADDLRDAAAEEREAQVRDAARRVRRAKEAAAAHAVIKASTIVGARLAESLSAAVERRRILEAEQAEWGTALSANRRAVRELETELATLTDSVHRDEMLRTEHRLRMEQLERRALDELGLDLDALQAEFGPDQLVPPPPAAVGENRDVEPVSIPYVRDEQQKRFRTAERALATLGKVNPLALEEFSALEERNKFLTEQHDDLKRTRRDLLEIVKDVDARVEQVFADAYTEVGREFEVVFAQLFPGGEGRLVLTDPGDLLAPGSEVEARPAGKTLTRLSRFSGGERSLVAVAFLVSLFKARPSPFYILDEVEAALDETNLGRLLDIFDELRATSQLLVITHQKRTMEIADALYGVSMRDDGITTVISQRLREAS